MSISGVTIANGVCTSCYGGGIYNFGTLTVANSAFSGNSANFGGGIRNFGTLTVTNSAFSNNSAFVSGGIQNDGTLTVTNSTFSDNSAQYGGGISNDTNGNLTVTNSTFSGNSSANGGGGIMNNSGTLTVTNSTFSGNSATTRGGGIDNASTLHLKNTLLANSTSSDDCFNGSEGIIATNTNNLIETNGPIGNECGTSAVTADPGLGALTGSPAYFPLNSGSPAINAGDDTVCAAAPVNNTAQNGVTRPKGLHCDIGSFEFLYILFLPLILR